MSEFTASTGTRVMATEGVYSLRVMPTDGSLILISSGGELALREFFQHERDQELGRWRWPENPDYVVYQAPDCADYDLRIMCESSGDSMVYSRLEDDGNKRNHPWESSWARAARAYFAAHPEPKPWHSAKLGEVWEVQTRTKTHGCAVVRGRGEEFRDLIMFRSDEIHIAVKDTRIESARLVWPEPKEKP